MQVIFLLWTPELMGEYNRDYGSTRAPIKVNWNEEVIGFDREGRLHNLK
jgi:hypothetical protein